MDAYIIALRIVHIVTGVFWVGGFFFFFLFVQPTAAALGPQAGPFMTHLANERKLPVWLTAAGLLTIVAGILLYIRSSNGFDPDWITSAPGMAITLGGIAAILGLANGFFRIKPVVDRIGEIGQAAAAAGRPPSHEQMGELQTLQRRSRSLSLLNFVLFLFAVLMMAVARYL